ncbi:MAG TPA: hypothetical protein VIU15_06660 [Streptomyces sp.]
MTVVRGGRHPRPTDHSLWKRAKGYGADSRPSRADYAPGSWVRWTDAKGRTRTGVISGDVFTLAAILRTVPTGSKTCRALVVPADGGEALPVSLSTSNRPETLVKATNGRWCRLTPSHAQPSLMEADAA